jgi:nicotinamide phosphoribosyltransferase
MKFYELHGSSLSTTDSYKPSHFVQYPPDTEGLHAYLEARLGARYSHTLFFGMRYILQRYFERMDNPITADEVNMAEEFWTTHGEPFNKAGWMKVVEEHGGRLPLRIRAAKEGTLIPIGNALVTVEATDPELWWLVTYVETMLMRLWYPTTVATRSFFCKEVIRRFLDKTSDNPADEIGFKLHDFGGRGVSSDESAGVGAMAHLVNFLGTDTVEGILHANLYYPTNDRAQWDPKTYESLFQMLGFSIPAMEHSTVIAWGAGGEVEAFRNMLRQTKARGHKLIACVSDTYDFFNCVENIWCGELLQEVRDSGMTVVVRPDSGDPTEVNREALRIFARKLGSEMRVNSKGYMVLPDYYRLIQGDGNDDERSIERVLHGITHAGFSASNIAFGMGGGLLQKLDRDTMRFAYKVSAINRGGKWIDTKKAPKTDPSKASKGGRLSLRRLDNVYITSSSPSYHSLPDAMETVFEDGSIKVEEDFATIRARAAEERL